jgi:hypothetical protein
MPALVLALVTLELIATLPAPAPPPPGDRAWATVKTVEGVTVKRAPGPGAPWGMGEGEIAAPLDRVVAHLTNFPSLARFMPRVAELRVLERGDDEALVYFRFDLPWPISDRDWTLLYRWRRDADRFVMTWSDANERGPAPTRAVRVAPVRGRWELAATARGTTLARYVFLAQLGGSLPRVIVDETAWRQPLGTFRGVRKALGLK